jgi:hypothetical protein
VSCFQMASSIPVLLRQSASTSAKSVSPIQLEMAKNQKDLVVLFDAEVVLRSSLFHILNIYRKKIDGRSLRHSLFSSQRVLLSNEVIYW